MAKVSVSRLFPCSSQGSDWFEIKAHKRRSLRQHLYLNLDSPTAPATSIPPTTWTLPVPPPPPPPSGSSPPPALDAGAGAGDGIAQARGAGNVSRCHRLS